MPAGPTTSLRTAEGELISVASCAQEVNFCRKLATELGFIQSGPTPIAKDNTGTIALLEHGHFKGRSKHVHLRVHYIDTGVLRLVQTPGRDQLADIGIKACPAPQLKFQRSLLHGGLSLDRRLTKWIAISELEKPRNRWDLVNFDVVKKDNIAITIVKPSASFIWDPSPTVCSISVIHPSSRARTWRSPEDIHLW
jgi:hypothetical protein